MRCVGDDRRLSATYKNWASNYRNQTIRKVNRNTAESADKLMWNPEH